MCFSFLFEYGCAPNAYSTITIFEHQCYLVKEEEMGTVPELRAELVEAVDSGLSLWKTIGRQVL
jgi:hypothetical protein